jgi:hypothetical protein
MAGQIVSSGARLAHRDVGVWRLLQKGGPAVERPAIRSDETGDGTATAADETAAVEVSARSTRSANAAAALAEGSAYVRAS